LNLYIDRTKPWALAKAATPESMAELEEVLYTLLEGIRWVATALLPVLPFGMPDVFRQLGVAAPAQKGAFVGLKWGEPSFQPVEPKPLYPRLEMPAAEATT
jgi:methionyl-tRNA synthetase